MTADESTASGAAMRQLGEREGEAFDRKLRDREASERAELLSRVALSGDLEEGVPLERRLDDREVAALRTRFRELAEFHDAVIRSAGWRLLQRVRRLAGRSW